MRYCCAAIIFCCAIKTSFVSVLTINEGTELIRAAFAT